MFRFFGQIRSRDAFEINYFCNQTKERIWVVVSLFLVLFAIISTRMVITTLFHEIDDSHFANRATPEYTGSRAKIVDRNGLLLATNIHTTSLYANPQEILDLESTIDTLHEYLPHLSKALLRERLSKKRRFIWIERHIAPHTHAQIHKQGLPGIYFQNDEKRFYPYNNLFAHVLGYTDIDDHGIAGVEKYFDDELKKQRPPLHLSLDVKLQYIMHDVLTTGIEEFRAIGAMGLVLNVKSGEVLSLISLPDYNPHDPSKASLDQLFNKVTLGIYEMGSTFKIFNTAMALEHGLVNLKDGYDNRTPIKSAGFLVRDHKIPLRWLSVPEIFMYSSNVGSAYLARLAGIERQKEFMKRLHLLDAPSLELPEIGRPRAPQHWRDINLITISYGHGLSVTPLQMASAVGAVINNGIYQPATLIKQPENILPQGQQIISETTSQQIRQLMRLVVEKGTGKQAEVKGYFLGGKTGTAEKPTAGGYMKKNNLSSFIAGFPMHDPEYLILIVLDEPKGNKATHGFVTAGWVSAPLAQRFVKRAAPILGIFPIAYEAKEVQNMVNVSEQLGVEYLASH